MPVSVRVVIAVVVVLVWIAAVYWLMIKPLIEIFSALFDEPEKFEKEKTRQ